MNITCRYCGRYTDSALERCGKCGRDSHQRRQAATYTGGRALARIEKPEDVNKVAQRILIDARAELGTTDDCVRRGLVSGYEVAARFDEIVGRRIMAQPREFWDKIAAAINIQIARAAGIV